TGEACGAQNAEKLVDAEEIGERQSKEFIEERLVTKTRSIFAPIKLNKMTFGADGKTIKGLEIDRRYSKTVVATLSSLIIAAEETNIPLESVFEFSLISIPPCFGNPVTETLNK